MATISTLQSAVRIFHQGGESVHSL